MKDDLQNQKNNLQKSNEPSKDQQEKVKRKTPILNKLILIVGCSIVVFVGMNFVSCNFMLPGSIQHANSLGILKNPPPTDCKESERRGYETLLAVLTTVIALKTKIED